MARSSEWQFTPAEQAYLCRVEAAQRLRLRLSALSLSELRELVDAFGEESEATRRAQERALALVERLGRDEELEHVRQLAFIGAHEAGGSPTQMRRVVGDNYQRINGPDFDRVIALTRRAELHVLGFVVGDHLPDGEVAALAIPGLDMDS
jgi:hypothetical protein